MKRILYFTIMLAFAGVLSAAEPSWKLTTENVAYSMIKNQQWKEMDEGWLFSCRLEVASLPKIRRVTHLLFEAFENDPSADEKNDSDEEVVAIWTQTKVVLRKKLDKKFGGKDGMFVRVMIKDVPEKAKFMTLKHVNEFKK